MAVKLMKQFDISTNLKCNKSLIKIVLEINLLHFMGLFSLVIFFELNVTTVGKNKLLNTVCTPKYSQLYYDYYSRCIN